MQNNSIRLLPFLIVGIIFALALSSIHFFYPMTWAYYLTTKHAHSDWIVLLTHWIKFYGVVFIFAYSINRSIPLLLLTSAVASFIMSVPFVWLQWSGASFTWLTAFSLVFLNAFHLLYLNNRLKTIDYPLFFHAIWDSVTKALIAAFFMGLCLLILFFSGVLFETVGITWVKEVLSKEWFFVGTAYFLFVVGLYIPSNLPGIIGTFQKIFYLISRFLLIPLSIIGIIFTVVFITSLSIDKLSYSAELSLITLAFLSVILLNGLYQEGEIANIYPKYGMLIVRIFLCITPVLSALAIYTIMHWKFQRLPITYVTNALVLFLFNAAYAGMAVQRKKDWLRRIEKLNVLLAVVVVGITLAMSYYVGISKLRAGSCGNTTCQRF